MKKNKIFLVFLLCLIPAFDVMAVSKVSCGNITDIPSKIPELTSFIVTAIQISVPIILVIMGSLDLFKGITAQKEDEIKKGQQIFIKRLIIGAIIFFVVVIVKFIISLISESSSENIIGCIDCFISNDCNPNTAPIKDNNSNSNSNSSSNNKPSTNSSSNNKPSTNSNSNSSSNNKPSTNSNSNSSSNNKPSTNSNSNSSSNNKPSTNSNSNSSSNNKPSTNSNGNSQSKKSLFFVGDSRTVGMCESYKLCEGNEYIAEVGKGYSWFINTAIPKINTKIKNKEYNIIILMGVNDVGSDGSSIAGKYFTKVSSLANNEWKKQNIIFVSVNPVVDGKSYAYMSGVKKFNDTMKSKINSSSLKNLKYCDTISKLNMTSIDSGDGLHYNKNGYKTIYNIIKNNCL